MKQYLNDLANYLQLRGEHYGDEDMLKKAEDVRSKASKVQDFVPSSETTNDEEDDPGGGGNHPKKPGNP